VRGLSASASAPRSRRSLSAMAVAAPAAAQQANREFAKQAHGFSLVQQQFVREYDSHVLMYKHDKTGGGPGHLNPVCLCKAVSSESVGRGSICACIEQVHVRPRGSSVWECSRHTVCWCCDL
jgi:hypothetical protein